MNVHADPRSAPLVRLPIEDRRHLYNLLKLSVGACPAGCSPVLGDATIYRSSRRSITMRCPHCGLQWTMTVHQIAKAAKRWPPVGDEQLNAVFDDFAAWMVAWADGLHDRRGRAARSRGRR